MKRKTKSDVQPENDGMRPEYDFSKGVRGKHYRQYQQGTNLVLLAPDVAEAFPTEEAVNEALRLLVRLAKTQVSRHR